MSGSVFVFSGRPNLHNTFFLFPLELSAWTPNSPAALFMYMHYFLFSASPPSRRKNKLSLGGYFSAQIPWFICARANSSRPRRHCVFCVFKFYFGNCARCIWFWVVLFLSRCHKLALPAPRSSYTYSHDVANKSIGRLGVFSFLTHTIRQRSNAGICDKLHFIAQLKSCCVLPTTTLSI
jgi:hypothetical protein